MMQPSADNDFFKDFLAINITDQNNSIIIEQPNDQIEPCNYVNVVDQNNSIIEQPMITNMNNDQVKSSNYVNDVQDLYKYINEIRVNIRKNNEIIEQLVTTLNTAINQLKRVEDVTMEKIAVLSGRVLINEGNIENVSKANKRISDIPKIHDKININKNEIEKLNCSNAFKTITNELDILSSQIEEMKVKINNSTPSSDLVNPIYHNEIPNNNTTTTKTNINYSNTIIDTDFLFVTDSNLAKINTSIINNGSKCDRFFCPTFEHIGELFQNATIINEPKVIFIHCGTNDLENTEFNENTFEDTFIKQLVKIRACCPSSEIIISSLLPRKEIKFKDTITTINDFLRGCCAAEPKLKFMFNNNITHFMLEDKKHINREGFTILLSNIRFTIFGKMPNYYLPKKIY